jgi:hypothetical protein
LLPITVVVCGSSSLLKHIAKMRFSFASVVAFATAVLAQTEGFHPLVKPAEGEVVPAGSTYEIVWQPDATNPGSVSIDLLGGGSPSTLLVLDTIACE